MKTPQTRDILKIWLEETYNLKGYAPWIDYTNYKSIVGGNL
jgi:hypothetical protein